MDAYVLRYQSDTAHPQDIVPIYFMHSLSRPFCPIESCECHTDQARIAQLLQHIEDGVMTLREAADFVEGRTV